MIVDAFVAIVAGLLSAIITALPPWVPPDILTSTWPGDLAAAVSWANGYFPVYDVGLCVGIVLGIRLLLAVWTIVVWVYDRFPFKFT